MLTAFAASLAVSLGMNSTQFTAGVTAAQAQLQAFAQQAQAVGNTISGVGQGMSLGITAPIVAFGVSALKTAADFDTAMATVKARSGESDKALLELREQAKALGADTSFSATEAAGAMAELAAANLDAVQIGKAMPGMLHLAAAGQLELADAASLSVEVMSQFGKQASDFGHIGDVLVAAANASTISVADMGESLKYAGTVAKSVGWSFEETAAAVAMMGNAGVKGSQAGTTLRGAVAALYNDSKRTSKALEALGVSAFDSGGKMKPLTQIITELAFAGAGFGDIVKIFGTEAATGIQAMVDKGGPALQELTTKLIDVEDAAKRNADVMTQGLNGALQSLSGSVETLKINLAESGIIETVTDLVNRFAQFVGELGKADKETLRFAVTVGIFLAAAGPVLVVLGSLVTVIGGIASGLSALVPLWILAKAAVVALGAATGGLLLPLTALAVGVAALAYIWVKNWEEIKATFVGASILIKEVGVTLWDEIKASLVGSWIEIKDTGAAVWALLQSSWTGLLLSAKTTWVGIKTSIKGAWDSVVSIVSGSALINAVRRAWSSVLGYLGSLVGSMLARGRAIMNALVRGIANAIRSLPGGGPIANWLERHLGGGTTAASVAGFSAAQAYSSAFQQGLSYSTAAGPTFSASAAATPALSASPTFGSSTSAGVATGRAPAAVHNHFHIAQIAIDGKDKPAEQTALEMLAVLQARAQAQLGDSMRWAEVQ